MKKLLALLLFVCSSAFAGDYVALVPGQQSWAELGAYSSTLSVTVTDAYGRTNTQASIGLQGQNSTRRQCSSGHPVCYTIKRVVTIDTASVANADGSPALASDGSVVTMVSMPVGSTDHWSLSAPLPVGAYMVSLSGSEVCTNLTRRADCGSAVWSDSITETSDALPITYFWEMTNDAFAQVYGDLAQVVYSSPNAADFPGIVQSLCDYPGAQIASVLSTFFSPVGYQVDAVVATPQSTGPASWTCTYVLIIELDPVNSPGVQSSYDLGDATNFGVFAVPAGEVNVLSGAAAPVLPDPPLDD
jgi:hypothetical protein